MKMCGKYMTADESYDDDNDAVQPLCKWLECLQINTILQSIGIIVVIKKIKFVITTELTGYVGYK